MDRIYIEKATTDNTFAFYSDDDHIKLIVNFYKNYYKPGTPYRIFRKEAEAVEWIRTIF